jgi:hypothetical protein
MAFVPTVDMVVWIPRRHETTAIVKGIDLEAGEMWLRPFTGGTRYAAKISDVWAEVKRNPLLVEAWFLQGARNWSGPYLSQAAADQAQTADTVVQLHVFPDGTSVFGYII